MLDWYLYGDRPRQPGSGLRTRETASDNVQSIPLNVFESDEGLTVVAPMPGIEADDLEISVLGEELRLYAPERGPGQERKEYLLREWSYGPYERRVRLPYAVDAERANASLGNGILVLTLPRAEATRPRKISLAKTGAAEGKREGHD